MNTRYIVVNIICEYDVCMCVIANIICIVACAIYFLICQQMLVTFVGAPIYNTCHKVHLKFIRHPNEYY